MTACDASYRYLFSFPAMVRALMQGFLSASLVRRLDLAGLTRLGDSFVSDDLRARYADAIWKVPSRCGSWSLCLMLEFQATVDRYMAVRLMTYAGLLYQNLLREGRDAVGSGLPLALPLVIHHGRERWKAPTRLSALMGACPPGLMAGLELEFTLLEPACYEDGTLRAMNNLVAELFRIERCRSLDDVPLLIQRWIDLLQVTRSPGLEQALVQWLWQRLRRWCPDEIGAVWGSLKEARDMTVNLKELWIRKWRPVWTQEGIRAGMQQGVQQGVVLGRRDALAEQLSRFLAFRFGSLDDEVRERIGRAGVAELEVWLDRALSVERPDQVFRD